MSLCHCGCGQETKTWFVKGHFNKAFRPICNPGSSRKGKTYSNIYGLDKAFLINEKRRRTWEQKRLAKLASAPLVDNRGWVTCRVCDVKVRNLKCLSSHLPHKHRISAKSYYDTFMKEENESTCQVCGKETFYQGLTLGYCKTCSLSCAGKLLSKLRKSMPWSEWVGDKEQLFRENARRRRLGRKYEEIFGKVKASEIRGKQSLHSGMKREEVKCKFRGKKSPEFCQKISKAKLGKKRPDLLGERNPFKRPEVIEKIKSYWRDPMWVAKFLKSISRKPNNKERQIQSLLDSILPDEYLYNDGWFILSYKIPDFVNINGKKKIIEFFGTYWHRNDNPQHRINRFAKVGYKTLVIWEDELKDIDKLKQKVIDFNGN